MKEIGVDVAVEDDLPTIDRVFQRCLQDMKAARSADMVKPTADQQSVENLFPAIAQWVRDGHIEIGDQEGFGFVVRALDYGGQAFEDDKPDTLAEGLAALEKGLAEYFERQGVEPE